MNNKLDAIAIEVELNGVPYVRKDSIKSEEIVFTGEDTVASVMIGKYAIIRSGNAGVNIGKIELADDTGVVIKNARRLKYHKPADKSLSWYEGVAVSGLSLDSTISGTVDRKVIIERYEITEVSEEIYKSIMEKTPNAQS